MIDIVIMPNGEKHCVRSSGKSLRAWFRTRETVTVEGYEEPTRHTVNVKKLFDWLKQPGKFPRDEIRKQKLRALYKG